MRNLVVSLPVVLYRYTPGTGKPSIASSLFAPWSSENCSKASLYEIDVVEFPKIVDYPITDPPMRTRSPTSTATV